MEFAWFKGHGTENDFVLLPDHDGTRHRDLDPTFVAALCDRRRGIGADGVMRVVRAAAAGRDSAAEWFMDYRNADGSLSQMCGNGVRVFVRHLLEEGLVEGPQVLVDTRDGLKTVTVDGDDLAVEMGPWTIGDVTKVTANGRTWSAVEVRTGNPHAVAFVDHVGEAGTLLEAPGFDPNVFPDGVNVEFVERDGRQLRMRVHERGSGETRSCGTGACATAIAAAHADRAEGPVDYRVNVPGGALRVTVSPTGTVLTGPAQIVAAGTMEWRR